MIQIEVVYAWPGSQTLLSLRVPLGTTVEAAIDASTLGARHPEVDWRSHRVGVFGRAVSVDHVLEDGDRIEIYRPLLADPKASRRERVEKRRAERGDERKMGA